MRVLVWAANVLGWPVIHFATAWLVLRRPIWHFASDSWLFKERRWEECGRFYRRWLHVHRWKAILPDGAPWLGGMSKKKVSGRNREYLYTFMMETRRAEFAHWCMIACFPVFFLWNPPWARVVMTGYAVIANLPCILAQRYNRIALTRMIWRIDRQ